MSIRLLLADDQVLARMGLRVLLEDAEDISIVGEAGSGREAIELARALRPDVILMDVKMGDGDGVEATRAIRQEDPAVRVLILSSYGEPSLLKRTTTAGAAGYVLKDISSADLILAIRAVYDGKTAIAPDIARQLLEHLTNNAGGGEATRRGPHNLTQRETDVLVEVARGLGDKEIAAKLYLAESTVKSHLRTVYRRLKLRNRAHAAAFAIERKLLNSPQWRRSEPLQPDPDLAVENPDGAGRAHGGGPNSPSVPLRGVTHRTR